MLAKLPFLFKQSAWLIVLLIMTSALPARAEEDDFPYIYTLTDDGTGYIISPDKYNCSWSKELFMEVPAVRPCDGKPVVGIEGFEYCEELMDLVFEDGCQLKYIGNNCFKGCKCIWNVENFPQTVETIGDYAFYGCTQLPNFNLGSNLKNIGVSAFEKCTTLTSITLPKSLKVLREWAFRYCTGLKSVVFENGVDFYTNDVYCFYNNVFDGCTNLSSVTLPKDTPGYFYIPMGTFAWCSSLKSIEFPANTRRIEQMAFYRSGLESLDLTKIELEEGPLYLPGQYTFAACENLTTVTANGKVQFDGLYTFQDCKALETVTFTGSGEDYTVMNPDIFKYCDNLQTVKFYRLKGNGQSNDMDSVFTGCKSLVSVTSVCTPEISKIGYSCFDGCTSLKTLSLPQTKFLINETAFRGCTALEELDFTNVTSIGKGSFSGCTGLTNLNFTDLTSIDTEAFKDCTALTSVNFNTSSETSFASTIGSLAFTGCTALKSLNFNSSSYDPPTVASEDAFDASHYNLTKVNMPEDRYRDFAGNAIWKKFDNLKRPEMYAYTLVAGGYSIRKGDYALEEDFMDIVEIPATYNSQDVVAIEEGAFRGLSFLGGVILPEGLTSIGDNAFAGCNLLTTVINKSTEPLTADACPSSAFNSKVYSDGTLTVPFGSLDAYSSTAPWSDFSTIKQGIGERFPETPTPTASPESGDFSRSFDLTLTNPGGAGTIYYYVVSEGDDEKAVHPTFPFTDPITIPTKTSKVWAYISWDYDGVTYCSEPVAFNYKYVPFVTEVGLDKVLSASVDDEVVINTNLYGHYHDGTYLYASTMGNSGSLKNTFNEDKKSELNSDKESDFIQEDWVAIADLTSDYVGQEIESGNLATVLSNTDHPVISFNEDVSSAEGKMGINTFRVENFNIHAENAAVSNIWLVAPQPAEYCSVKGYVKTANVNAAEGYLVLQSAESTTTNAETPTTYAENTEAEPLTMNVYYDAATISLDADGWYYFAGIVSKESDALKFTALKASEKPIYTGIEDVDAGTASIFAANGNINVAADTKTSIAVYSANGQLINAIEASSATIAVTPGFYIVKVGNQVTKLAVR